MSSSIDKMESDHMCARAIAHLVDCTWRLIDAPVASPCDVLRGHVYGAARKCLHLGDASGIRTPPYAIALQRTVKTGPAIFGRVHIDPGFGEPFATGDVIRRRHERRNGCRHALV